MPESLLYTPELRRRAVAWAVALAADTSLAPSRYERQLLDRYVDGELTLDEVSDRLDSATYYVLYRSRATAPPTEAELQLLLEQARAWNAEADLTGLLLYSDGRYVQVLEGSKEAVQTVVARIRRDPRHTQVITMSEGFGPARRFSAWRMAMGNVAQPCVARLLDAALADEPFHGVPLNEPLLSQLLEAFGVSAEDEWCAAA